MQRFVHNSPNKYTILIAGICALIATMGFARYSFTPMIPHMQTQIGMSESLAGWLAGWNYLGYLTGLFMVWLMRDLRLKDFFYRYGLFLSVFTTAIMAAHTNELIWYLSRFFAGISTALGFMLGSGLVFKWLLNNGHRQRMGVHFAGAGLGIILSALVVELTVSGLLDLNWREQWLVLAGFGFLFTVPAFYLLPLPGKTDIEAHKVIDTSQEPSRRWLLLLTIAYICAGFSNTANVTFTSLMTEYIPLAGEGTLMWVYVGLAAAPAPFIWQRVGRQIGFLNAIRAAFALNIVSNLLLVFYDAYFAVMLSALTFGFAFMGIVSLVLSIIGNKYGQRSTQIMAQLTLGYCLAQIISPILTGTIAEMTGDFRLSLYIISGIMACGIVCLALMRRE